MENPAAVPENLKAKNDGRKVAWWVKKIDQLEAELAAKQAQVFVTSTNGVKAEINHSQIYADGFVDCMHRFQLLNKAARQRIHQQILVNGPGYVKRLKGSKFRGFSI